MTSSQEYKLIPLALIDDPKNPMRLDVEDTALEELMASIETHGLLQPILLRSKGGRYLLIAGHRRLAAFWRLHRADIPAIIADKTDSEALGAEIAENIDRLDTDPVGEAVMIARALEQLGVTPKELAAKVHRSEKWVYDRLDIAKMPDYLQKALHEKKIPIGVALELFLIIAGETPLLVWG